MPILAKHEGVWEGYYRHLDTQGRTIDTHRSRLLCRFAPEAGEWDYHQTNLYYWDDGKKEVREFPPAPNVLANLEAFADAAEGRAPYPVPQSQMIANISALEAIFKSAATGSIVNVES